MPEAVVLSAVDLSMKIYLPLLALPLRQSAIPYYRRHQFHLAPSHSR